MVSLVGRCPVPADGSVVLLELAYDRACRRLQGPLETALSVLGEIDPSSDRQMHRRACSEGDAPRYEKAGCPSAVARGVETDQRTGRGRWNAQFSGRLQLRASRSEA